MIVDFRSFKSLIDNIGGVDVNVPAPILSNKFDCPYKASRCARWPGYRFHKGMQHMNGQRALVYSRIRENQLNPADSDITRGLRQQAVMRAVMAKLLGFGTVVKLPFNGDSLLQPLTTDLSAWQFVQLGWVIKRAGPDERPPLPARRNGNLDRRRVGDRGRRGEPLRRSDGHGPRCAAASAPGIRTVRSRLRRRQPAVPLVRARLGGLLLLVEVFFLLVARARVRVRGRARFLRRLSLLLPPRP